MDFVLAYIATSLLVFFAIAICILHTHLLWLLFLRKIFVDLT